MACRLMDSRVEPARKEVEVSSKLNWLVCRSTTYSYAKKVLDPSLVGMRSSLTEKNGELQRSGTKISRNWYTFSGKRR